MMKAQVLLREAKTQKNNGETDNAIQTLNRVMNEYPGSDEAISAQALRDRLRTDQRPSLPPNPQVYHIVNNTSGGIGIAAFVTGILSIFVLSLILVPLATILGIIGLLKGQKTWSILGLVCAFIGFLTSPIMLGIIGLSAVGISWS